MKFNITFEYIHTLIKACQGDTLVGHDSLEPLLEDSYCEQIVKEYQVLVDERIETLRNTDPSHPCLKIKDKIARETMALPVWDALKLLLRTDFTWCCFYALIRACGIFLQIWALNAIIDVCGEEGKYSTYNHQYLLVEMLLALALGVGAYTQSLMQHNIFHFSFKNGIRARALVCGRLFQKSLSQTPLFSGSSDGGGKAKKGAKGAAAAGKGKETSSASMGQQMNLISSDSNIIIECFVMLMWIFSSPVEIIAALVWVGLLTKWAVFGAAVLSCLLLPIQLKLGGYVGQYRRQSFQFADKRITALTEYLGGIGVVKFNCWENPILELVTALRGSEAGFISSGSILKLLNLTVFFIIPGVLSLTLFGLMNIYDSSMDGRTTFTVMALLQIIARTFAMVPRSTTALASALSSVERIESFLKQDFVGCLPPELTITAASGKVAAGEEEENEEEGTLKATGQEQQQRRGFVRVKGDFCWSQIHAGGGSSGGSFASSGNDSFAQEHKVGSTSLPSFVLQSVDLTAESGSLTCIVGSVGSGKSTLLHAILRNCALLPRDMSKIDSEAEGVYSKGSVAYVPQEAWIRDGTVRDNILFDLPYDEETYWKVLCACNLLQDLLQWGGDFVEVGEKGVTLSGGQRQRVAMARACYCDADIYLLDDPLSAVDAHVSSHLLEQCICHEEMLKKKTVILVTHNALAISKATSVIRIEDDGYFNPVQAVEDPEKILQGIDDAADGQVSSEVNNNPIASPAKQARGAAVVDEEEVRAVLGKGRILVTAEEGVAQGVSASVYLAYLRAGGTGSFLLFIFTLLLAQATRNAAEWWFAAWANRKYNIPNSTYLWIEFALVVGGGLIAGIRTVAYSKFCVMAATTLHDKMFKAVLSAPMHFFETVPLGRIINRFAKDLDNCDDLLPRVSFDFLQLITVALGSLGLLIFSIPWFAIVVALFLIVFVLLVKYYIPAARQMKRVEASSRSPSHQLFQATLVGMTTIRAFGKENVYADRFYKTVDITSRAVLSADSCQRWVGVRMDWMTATWVFSTGLFCVGLQDSLNRSIAGLALGQSLMLTGLLQFSVRMAAETESLFTSVERIDEYGKIEKELDPFGDQSEGSAESAAAIANEPVADNETSKRDDTKLSEAADWPQEGRVIVKNLTVTYPSNPGVQVLQDVNFIIEPGEKMAIVGRTGAGKSTILQCFFRLLAIPEESIEIDGVRIGKIPLKNVRSGLSVIPQNPTLFHGTIRKNLDPFSLYEDDDLIEALLKVQLLKRLLRDALASTPREGGGGGGNSADGLPSPTANIANMLSPQHSKVMDEEGNEDIELTAAANSAASTATNIVKDIPTDLKTKVLEYHIGQQGSALSVGQKQLLCAARALLRRPKVLLMDEATANVDTETDAALQTMIRDACKETTVITIAHRLNTIMDYDKVVVLHRGVVAEIGNPRELVEKFPEGPFGSMIASSIAGLGKTESRQ